MGKLRDPDGGLRVPSILEATKYLPSLHNAVWEKTDRIADVPLDEQNELDRSQQLAIRRSRLSVEILKRPSDDQTKYDLFQRLNAGGTQANAQELRNCIMLMVNPKYFHAIRSAAEECVFTRIMSISEEQSVRQRHIEYAVRFLVHTCVPYDGILDIEEYIDEGIVKLANDGDAVTAANLITNTFQLLMDASGENALRRFEGGRHSGRVGLVGLEGIAVGVAKNLAKIRALDAPAGFVKDRIENFWSQPETADLTAPGLRGTIRIQRTVPFGERWFRP